MPERPSPIPNPDLDLDAIARVTYSAVFSDICDALGIRHQTVNPGLAPIGSPGTLVGWARTGLSQAVEAPPSRHYGNEIDFIDSLRPGDVAVIVCPQPVAAWGELFSTAAKGRGARGAVVDGLIRDSEKIKDLGFPVFTRGCRPTDSLGRISLTDMDGVVQLGGVALRSGDLVVADADGITVVPRPVALEAIERALEKVATENKARELLLAGGLLAEVWERFRVL